MSSGEEVKGIIGCLMIGGGLLWRAIKKHKKARQVQDTPRSKVASAPQGYVELQGFAWPIAQTFEGGEGYDTVYYSFTLQKQVTKGHGKSKRREWETVFVRVHADPFYLVDGTGLVRVIPIGAELELGSAKTRDWQRVSKKDKDRILEKVVNIKIPDFPPHDFMWGLFGSRYRIIEYEIPVGSPVYVNGDLKANEGLPQRIQATGLTNFYGRLFDKETKVQKNLKTLIDKNQDGKISADEALHGYRLAGHLALKKSKTENVEETDFEVFGNLAGSQNRKLFLANAHEEHVVQRLNKFVWLQFVGGALLVTLGLGNAAGFKMPAKRTIAAATEASEEEINNLHYSCVGGDEGACKKLLKNKSEFKLTEQHINYYQSKIINP